MRKNFCKHCGGDARDTMGRTYCDWCGDELPSPGTTGYFRPHVKAPEPKAWKEERGLDYPLQAILALEGKLCEEAGMPISDLIICLDCALKFMLEAREKREKA